MSVTSDLLGSTVLIFDIVASFTKLSIRTPNRNIQAGSRAPVIIAISVPVMMSTMSQPSANLNYSHVKECEKTQEKTESESGENVCGSHSRTHQLYGCGEGQRL